MTEGLYKKLHTKSFRNIYGGISSKTYYQKVGEGETEIISIEDENDTPGFREVEKYYSFAIECPTEVKDI